MGDRLEERKDFTEDLKVKVPEATRLTEGGKLNEALDLLMTLERNCRVGNDFNNLKEVVLTMARLCKAAGDWEQLNATATLLAKRRGQQGRTITAMVQECMLWLDETPDKATKIALIVALRDITDGKIFVEGERARLTRLLADIKEKDGDVAGAQEVLQEVAVETYGALDKKEKTDFILEQVRLTLLKKDYVRALIQSRKINRKIIEGDDMQELKVRFYRLMLDYDLHEKDPFSLCCDYHAIFATAIVKADAQQRQAALKSCVVYLVLSPYTNTQQDMLHRVSRYPELDELTSYKTLLKLFTTYEIIDYPLPFAAELEAHIKESIAATGTDPELGPPLLKQWLKDLHTRVVQHNIRVAAKYYKQIRTARLATLLGLDEGTTERSLSTMVSDGTLYARINRPEGIISFSKPQPSEEVLSSWNSDLSSLLRLLEHTTHLINKETMLAGNVKA